MNQAATWYGDRPRPRPHRLRLGPSCPQKRGHSSPHYRNLRTQRPICLLWPNGWMNQDATWYMEVGLGPGDIVLDGGPAPPPQQKGGTAVPSIRPMSSILRPNGWMDEDATWYVGKPRPRPHCVTWEPSSPMETYTVRLCGFRHISTSGLGVVYRLFCNLLHQISRLSTIRVAFDVKRRLPTLFPVLPKPEVVFNGQTVVDRFIYCIKVE